MKLSECTYGRMVITENLEVGHIVGVTYNISLKLTGGMTDEDLFQRTIPLVQFADRTCGVHPGNLKPFAD